MYAYIALAGLWILAGCQSKKMEHPNDPFQHFYVGTYTDSDSQGIYAYALHNDGRLEHIGLAARSENPSFLTKSTDGRFLLAVNEINEDNSGTIESFFIAGDSLHFISKSTTGGAHPCFVTVNNSGYVLVANYTGGNVGLLRVDAQGQLSPMLDVQQHTGSGTTDRQEGPHAHSAWFEPSGERVISVDLGTNQLWFSQLDTTGKKLVPVDPQHVSMAPGAGPRHLVFHPNGRWIYVVNELNGTVALIVKNEKTGYDPGPAFSTLPADFDGPNTCADIHISSDGRFVYASNRGHDSIAIFEVNDEDGHLRLLAHQSTMGSGPRNFAISPDQRYVVVANQYTDNLVSLRRDQNSGLLTFIDEIEAPTPVCILF